MLKIISILTLLYFLSSTALPEKSSSHDGYQGFNDNNQQPLPLKLAEAASRSYYGAGGKHAKPCSRRKSQDASNAGDQELLPTPTYSARVVKTYQGNANTNLEPQSLRNVPSKDNVEENYDNVYELYSSSDVIRKEGKDQTSDNNKDNSKNTQQGKVKEASNDDNKEVSNRNSLHYEKEDSVQYEKDKSGNFDKKLTVAQHNYKNSEVEYDKVDENNQNVKNADTQSDKVNLKNDDVETKAHFKEFARDDNDHKNSKLNSKELGAPEENSRSTNAYTDKSHRSNYDVKNSQSQETELTDLYYKVKSDKDKDVENKDANNADTQNEEKNFNGKKFQAYNEELDDAQLRSYQKYLSESLNKARNADTDRDNVFKADYGVKDSKSQTDVLSAENHDDKNSRVHNSENKGFYFTPYKNKVYGDDLNKAHYKNKEYRDDLGSESNERRSRYSDEIEEALYGVRRNRADSDELNDALYEIRRHLAHSEELKDALREVGKKGKTYSDVLSNALYKVKKHKAQSEEFNNDHYGENSADSDSSENDKDHAYKEKFKSYSSTNKNGNNKQDYSYNKKSKAKHYSVIKSGYKESDQQSRAENSDEDDHKCPSKQQNVEAHQYDSNDATRRFLTDTNTESESVNSASSEDVSQRDAELNEKYEEDDKDDSETAEDKEGEDFESENNAYVEQTGAASQRRKPGYDLTNPAQGPGVSELSANGFNLMDHSRVCYACSSDFNPSCFEPSRRTTVKYCHLGHENCITKTFTYDNHKVVIRDCGDSCNVGNSGSGPVWNSCDVCTGDLCNDKPIENGAFSINSQSLAFTVFVIFAIKFTM